ncbi:type IV pilus twitching motility protein PilT [Candidatus Sumerlaeota bacterium]|nr:type IV pilus twitching motility protein PilT [Candidatus Sumerlaeota bacterium]
MSGGGTASPNAPQPVVIPEGDDMVGLLIYALENGISDVHLTPGYPPMIRIHGTMAPTTRPILDRDTLHNLLYDMLTDDQRKRLERDKELDFALQLGDKGRFRVNCFFNMKGEGAVFRNIPSKILSFEDLNSPPILKAVAHKPRGMVLVTGPTGSGKSTTLAAMVDYINSNFDKHILTIEDPIEFVHHPKRGIVNQRELGSNTKSFAAALRSALREDPDVILIGEMRDLETISLALTASETGHLVFGTMHTQSAPKTCDRLLDVFPANQQGLVRMMFSESFQAICCQTLIPKKDGTGRVCAMEILIGTSAARALIREGKTHQLPTVIQTGAKYGMQSLDQNLKDFVMRGVITEEAALERANNPEFIARGGEDRVEQSAMGTAPPAGQRPGAMGGVMAAAGGRGAGMSKGAAMPTMDTMGRR